MNENLRKRLHALDREDTAAIIAFIADVMAQSDDGGQDAMAGNQLTPRVRYGHILEALQAYDNALTRHRDTT